MYAYLIKMFPICLQTNFEKRFLVVLLTISEEIKVKYEMIEKGKENAYRSNAIKYSQIDQTVFDWIGKIE
jgi:hypothetical protein